MKMIGSARSMYMVVEVRADGILQFAGAAMDAAA